MQLKHIAIFPLLILSCSGPAPKPDGEDTIKQGVIVDNNPMTADSITPSDIKDTAKLSEYGKDSLRMGIAFQRAANDMCRSIKTHDALGYLRFTPPNIIRVFGGKEKFLASLKKNFESETRYAERVVAGPVKRVAAAIDDEGYSHGWYCLMPVRQFLVDGGNKVMDMQWFGGQTLDGIHFYFINVTDVSKEHIAQLMPDLRYVLDPETGMAQ